MRIAYLVSRFPKITETFVLYEMLALEESGAQIELYPLVRQQEAVVHPEAARLIERAHFVELFGPAVAVSQFYWLSRSPGNYLSLWRLILRAYWGRPRYLLRSMAAIFLGAHFARRMAADRIEHIHAHFATHAALAALAIHRLTGIPFSFTAHAHDIYVEQALLETKIQEAAFVATISEHNRAYLGRLCGEAAIAKVQVVRCGVDRSFFSAPVSRTVNQTITILCIASLEEKKGHRYLLDACRMLGEREVDFRCILIGDGPLRSQIETQISAQNLQEQVILLGQQTRCQVRQNLAAADLVVLPSIRLSSGKQEGIPVALMEAMAMGLPVIATDLSGIPELVEEGVTGLLVPERDPEAIASSVEKLVARPTFRKELGIAGREKVLKEYDLKENAAQLYGLMKRSSAKRLATERLPLSAEDVIGGLR